MRDVNKLLAHGGLLAVALLVQELGLDATQQLGLKGSLLARTRLLLPQPFGVVEAIAVLLAPELDVVSLRLSISSQQKQQQREQLACDPAHKSRVNEPLCLDEITQPIAHNENKEAKQKRKANARKEESNKFVNDVRMTSMVGTAPLL